LVNEPGPVEPAGQSCGGSGATEGAGGGGGADTDGAALADADADAAGAEGASSLEQATSMRSEAAAISSVVRIGAS
jgi:hypothetical protein